MAKFLVLFMYILHYLKIFNSNILIVLNKYSTDVEEEIQFVKNYVLNLNIPFEISDAYSNGSVGAIDVANKIIELCNNENNFKFLYDLNDIIKNKINIICKEIYHASNIIYTDEIIEKIKKIDKLGLSNLPICIAKTQYSLSDNPKLLGNPTNFEITIKDICLKSGAGFIVVFLGNIIDMPGLSKYPNALNMTIDNDIIDGLF